MSDKKLTLEQLKSVKPLDEVKEVDPDNVAKTLQEKHNIKVEKEERYDSYLDQVISTVGEKVSDEMFEKAKEIINIKREEMLIEEYDEDGNIILDEEDNDDDEDELNSDYTRSLTRDLIDEFDEEFGDEEDFDSEKDYEKQMEMIKSKVKEKIKPVADKIDLDTFTISNKPISLFKAFENSNALNTHIADWVLLTSGVKISMAEMKGYDIDRLNPRNSSRNDFNTFKDIYTIIYDHIVNEDKPELEEFLKLLRFSDIPHLYFSIYRSSFNENNILTYTCPKCNEIFIEDVMVDEMYRFKNEDIEREFNKIMSGGSEFKIKQYETELVQISDMYVVSLREPSIFNVIFETLSLSESFREKYNNVIGTITYIEDFYLIDRETNSLIPINLRVYENDLGKTVRYKIMQYSKILSSLNSDQFYTLTSMIKNISKDDDIRYVIPERECPKCKNVIPESEQSPENLLFTRHQMGVLASI